MMSTLRMRLIFSLALIFIGLGFFLYFFYPIPDTDPLIALSVILGVTFITSALLVFIMTLSPGKHILRISESIRGLTFGEHGKRLDVDLYGQLKEIARAFNELASHLGEKEDPNLGRISREKRIYKKSDKSLSTEGDAGLVSEKDHNFPCVGRVRKIGETKSTEGEHSKVNSESKDEIKEVQYALSVLPALDLKLEEEFSELPSEVTESGRDTVIDMASASVEAEKPIKSKEEVESYIQSLYHEYVRLSVEMEMHFDVEFKEFEKTIAEESQRLIVHHGCKDVEFEVCLQDGDVSLQPRLIR